MFLALAAVITVATTPDLAHAQRIREYERVEVHARERVHVRQEGPRMLQGQRYDAISYGHRGLVALNVHFGGGRQRQSFEPVRHVSQGDCFVRVDGARPPANLETEIERMRDGCFAVARRRGDPRPRVVVELY